MRTHLLLFILFLAFCHPTFSQKVTITGKVTSKEEVKGIPGVTVVIKGTVKGTTTDMDGNYSLPGVTQKDTLRFSFIGYETFEIAVGKNLKIDVVLQVSMKELEEVVVTAFGIMR